MKRRRNGHPKLVQRSWRLPLYLLQARPPWPSLSPGVCSGFSSLLLPLWSQSASQHFASHMSTHCEAVCSALIRGSRVPAKCGPESEIYLALSGVGLQARWLWALWKKLKVKVTQLCPTLCDQMDCMAHGILQVRVLEGLAIPFSRGSSQPRDRCNWTVKYTLGFKDLVWKDECKLVISHFSVSCVLKW